MKEKSIAVFGCGWLGLPLAKKLVQEGFQVNGSTTSKNKIEILSENKIKPFLLDFQSEFSNNLSQFLEARLLVVNIPPSKLKLDNAYSKMIKELIGSIKKSPIENVIFISATSVYPSENKEVKEEDAVYGKSERSTVDWLAIEDLFRKEKSFKTTIIRFSGLMGGNYQPARWVSGRKLKGANSLMNMIHRDDCVEIIFQIIEQGVWNETFNAAAPIHPTRKEFYTNACAHLGVDTPVFLDDETAFIIVNSDKLQKKLNYKFIHPNPSLYFE